MLTTAQRKKRLTELRESTKTLAVIRLHYQHVLETQLVALEQADEDVQKAVQHLEELKLQIHTAPEKISECNKRIKQIDNEAGTMVDSKYNQLLALKAKVAALEAELIDE